MPNSLEQRAWKLSEKDFHKNRKVNLTQMVKRKCKMVVHGNRDRPSLYFI